MMNDCEICEVRIESFLKSLGSEELKILNSSKTVYNFRYT